MKKLVRYLIGLFLAIAKFGKLTDSFHCDYCRDADVCDTVSGTFRMTGLGKGYHPVVTVPRGACYANITELRKSSNVLALKDVVRNQYIINGYWSMDKAGVYNGVGSTFVYRKSDSGCPGECLTAEGPLLSQVLVQLLYLDSNPGIFYSFKIAKHLKNIPEVTTPFPWGATYRHPPADRSELREAEVGYQDVLKRGTTTPSSIGGFPKLIPIPGQRGIYHRGPIFSSDFTHRRKPINSHGQTRSRGERLNNQRQALRDVTYSRGIDDDTVRRENSDYSSEHEESDVSLGYGTDIKSDVTLGYDDGRLSILEDYVWRLSENTSCSRPCGGGIQEKVYECIDPVTLEVVDDSNCDPSLRPESQYMVCNEDPCTPVWHTSEWSTCSASCGEGHQTRNVTCTQRISATDTQPLEDMYCTSQKPADRKQCYAGSCYRWVSGDWGDCSKQCGIGTRRRLVQCRDDAGRVVNSNQCDQSAPVSEESCDMGTCSGQWYYSNWDTKCSSVCGTGVVTRRVYCATASRQVLPDDNCDVTEKPETEKPCISEIRCGNGTWFTGPWSQCSTSCGEGIQSRHVVCVVMSGYQVSAVTDSHCDAANKPNDRKECTERDCGYMWLRSEWSECSKTCDSGSRTRSVKCVDTNLRPSTLCKEEDRPPESEDCNTGECWDPVPSQSARCSDKYPNCAVVVQARLCRYPYYMRKCCRSCSSLGYPSRGGTLD